MSRFMRRRAGLYALVLEPGVADGRGLFREIRGVGAGQCGRVVSGVSPAAPCAGDSRDSRYVTAAAVVAAMVDAAYWMLNPGWARRLIVMDYARDRVEILRNGRRKLGRTLSQLKNITIADHPDTGIRARPQEAGQRAGASGKTALPHGLVRRGRHRQRPGDPCVAL